MFSNVFIVCVCVCLLFVTRTSGQDAAAACSGVMQQGVYNTFSSSSSSTSYSQFQSAVCSLDTAESYSDYAKSAAANSASSSAYSWNVAASGFGFGGSGGASGSNSVMTADEYAQTQSLSSSYQKQYCGSNSGSSGDASEFNSFMQTLNPQVFDAYQSCIALYTTGIEFSNQYGYGSSSAFINVKFSSKTFGAKAILTGISIVPEHGAGCTLFGDTGATQKFFLNLVPDETYSIACRANTSSRADVITVGISTTQGTYLTYLYNREPPLLVKQVQDQVTTQQSQITRLTNDLATVQAILKLPVNITVLRTGTGIYNTPKHPSPSYLKVKMVGAGAGGSGANDGASGTSGGNTLFGTNLFTAYGGSGNKGSNCGGCGSMPTGTSGFSVCGGCGGSATFGLAYIPGGVGGTSYFGGSSAHNIVAGTAAFFSSPGSNGAGGPGGMLAGGCSGGVAAFSGAGGGAGGYLEAIIADPKSSYTYTVGAGGALGSGNGSNGCSAADGFTGNDGLIIVEAYFN